MDALAEFDARTAPRINSVAQNAVIAPFLKAFIVPIPQGLFSFALKNMMLAHPFYLKQPAKPQLHKARNQFS
jgi:hypothetical protein